MSSSQLAEMSRLHFSPEQLEYIQTLNNIQTKQASGEEPQATAQQEDEPSTKKKPIDQVEKDQQPADNDDDEKLADNHRKMSKIELKKEEIRKLEDTHQALTKDAVIQAKSGASMKKVQHNLKIAKSVAQRVQDLKQQVDSDQKQLQQVTNLDEIQHQLPFKKDTPTIHHDDVKNIPSVQDSSTGARHSPNILGNFLATKQEGMTIKKKGKKKHTKKYYEDIQNAKNQIKVAEQGMKSMDSEVKEFHNHMAESMSGLMKAFNDGFAALDKAKKEEVPPVVQEETK